MREIALNNIALMLTIYAATLVWSMQHIADHYTPKLVPFFLRHIAILPLSLLGILLVIAGLLVLRPLPHLILSFITFGLIKSLPLGGDILALILLLGAIGTVLWAGYRVAQHLTDGTRLISWLNRKVDQQAALQEILLNAIPRTDKNVVAIALDMGLSSQLTEQAAFVDWLIENSNLFANDWLARILLRHLLFNRSNSSDTKIYENLLSVLLTEALDDEAFPRALFIVGAVFDFLEHTSWQMQSRADILYRVGFAIWRIGERSASAPRLAKIPGQLEQLKELFIGGVHKVWNYLLKLKDPKAVQAFSRVLGQLTIETRMDTFFNSFLSCIQDLMNQGFCHQLLTLQAIHGLASDLGIARQAETHNDNLQRQIDVLLIHLAAMHIELGGSAEALDRLLENGYVQERLARGTGFRVNKHDWLKPESYMAVAKRLLIPDFE